MLCFSIQLNHTVNIKSCKSGFTLLLSFVCPVDQEREELMKPTPALQSNNKEIKLISIVKRKTNSRI